ncbi:tpiA [Wigglesworthia glossinidia endosymbiont of Glossina brevipalpis]|uniref:Triosephosphate isomerase n=1 Tax=Wigglesworthia glossinidia brevipalpis TaxID=36870 RepID=TPIS_WIGBR|nr:RecName: Full=Triosephosphate isomerase; Short=TIM; Short=TPI; AltName: Full=Triose-phosphate isomerase [Wigglesworthia glossinidia endosymbiont of Glossina brevipalpis]BAC24420.1 tpiA [Wigglesworthia glossinidia endosymbiont of Glossina brevipalpis]
MKLKPLILSNWKLNGNCLLVKKILLKLNEKLKNKNNLKVVIAPPVIYLSEFKKYVLKKNIFLAAQNVDVNLTGSFTGEISPIMLYEFGVKYVIIGHSERRLYHNESIEDVTKKFLILKKFNLIPVLCIGETKKNKDDKCIENEIVKQIDFILKKIGIEGFINTVIAYEPTWAIGKKDSASPKYIQKIHKFIRNYLSKYDNDISKKIILQYGGSVNSKNVKKIISQKDVNGVLLGRSSTNIEEFLYILDIIEKTKKS